MAPQNKSAARNYDIYGIGAALVDTEIEVIDQDLENFGIEKGVMTLVDENRQSELMGLLEGHLVASRRASGGSAANSIIAASYFGAKTFYSCKVANDDNGSFYLSDLESAGVDYHAESGSNSGITGKCLVMITPDAERTMNTFLGISETLSTAEIDEDALRMSNFVYIEGYLVTSQTGRAAAAELKHLAEKFQVKTALSLSDPAIVEYFHTGLEEIIDGGVDILFCNEAEAMKFTGSDSLENAMENLKRYARTYAITRGAKGALVFDGNNIVEIAAFPVEAVDSNGAGDMFAGAFLYAISQGQSYLEAGKLASRASSVIVSQYGPRLAPEQHQRIIQLV